MRISHHAPLSGRQAEIQNACKAQTTPAHLYLRYTVTKIIHSLGIKVRFGKMFPSVAAPPILLHPGFGLPAIGRTGS